MPRFLRAFIRIASLNGLLLKTGLVLAQPDYQEFPKNSWVLPLEVAQGFNSGGSRYLFSAQVSPQATLVPHTLRLGLSAGGAYTADQWTGYAGPRVAFAPLTIAFGLGASRFPLGNVHFFAEHLWGANHVRLAGGGVVFDLLKTGGVSLKFHRDYGNQTTWGQVGLHFNVLSPLLKKQPEDSP
jgi:hypothetical protein